MENTVTVVPDYSDVVRAEIPTEYTWNHEDIFADSVSWEKELNLLTREIEEFDSLKEGWLTDATKCYNLLQECNSIDRRINSLYTYTSLHSDTEMDNSVFQAMKGKAYNLYITFYSKLSFIEPDIIKAGRKQIDKLIESKPELKSYNQTFDSTLRMTAHVLPEEQEQIITRTALFSDTPGKASSILNDVDIPAPTIVLGNGKRVKLNQANYSKYRSSANPQDRKKVMQKFWKNHAGFKNTHAILLNGVVKNHHFNALTRKYSSCLEAALYPNNISTDVYNRLVETIKSNLTPLHNYLQLKKEMLGIEDFHYYDIYASSIPEFKKEFSIDEARELVTESMRPLGNEYSSLISEGLNSRWMDIYPNRNKRSGAYSNGSVYDTHPFVLMNFDGKFRAVSTLTHEFGHALHSWFSNRTQEYHNSHYPIFLAEIASTFNENLLTEYLLKKTDDPRFRLYLLDQYLENVRATLFRQVLFADFELKIHSHAEKGETLTSDWLNMEYLNLTKEYYGHKQGVVKVDKFIENEWSLIPHFYYNFYVYQYSTGIIASTALSDMVLQGGASEQKAYLNFLKSGCSKYSLDILKETGVDLTSEEPTRKTLSKFEEMTNLMRKTAEKLGLL